MNAYPVQIPADELPPQMVSLADDVASVLISHGLPRVSGPDWTRLVDLLEGFVLGDRAMPTPGVEVGEAA